VDVVNVDADDQVTLGFKLIFILSAPAMNDING
jgi:hypothetical protein